MGGNRLKVFSDPPNEEGKKRRRGDKKVEQVVEGNREGK